MLGGPHVYDGRLTLDCNFKLGLCHDHLKVFALDIAWYWDGDIDIADLLSPLVGQLGLLLRFFSAGFGVFLRLLLRCGRHSACSEQM